MRGASQWLAYPELEYRLAEDGVLAVVAALEAAARDEEEGALREALVATAEALRMSGHVLADDPTQLAAQLCGRLRGSALAGLRQLVAQAPVAARAPTLVPRTASLIPPGGALRWTIAAHFKDGVHGLAVVTERGWVVTGGGDGAIRVWDAVTGLAIRTLRDGGSGVTCLAISGGLVVSGHATGAVEVRSLEDGRHRVLCGDCEPAVAVDALAVTPDARVLVGRGAIINVMRIVDGSRVTGLVGHTDTKDRITTIKVSGDGRRAVSVADDNEVIVWDLGRGVPVASWRCEQAHRPAVGWMADGSGVVTIDRAVRGWSPAGERSGPELENRIVCTSAAVAADGGRVVIGGGAGSVSIVELRGGAAAVQLGEHSERVNGVALVGDAVFSASGDGTLRAWDAGRRGREVTAERHLGAVSTLCAADVGRWVFSASLDGTIRQWDVARGVVVRSLPGDQAPAHVRPGVDLGAAVMQVSREGGLVVAAIAEGTLRAYDTATGAVLWDNRPDEILNVGGMGLTPDGSRLVCHAHRRRLSILDARTGAVLRTLGDVDARGNKLVVMRDLWVPVPCGTHVEWWSLREYSMRGTLSGPDMRGVHVAVPDPDGRMLITGSVDGDVRVFGRMVREVARLDLGAAVTDLAVAPDGSFVVVTARDRTVRVLSLPNLRTIAAFVGDADMQACVVPTRGAVVAGDVHGNVHILDLSR